MKKILNILIGLTAAICLSCTKDEIVEVRYIAPEVVGDWHLVMETCEGEEVAEKADVYLSIKSDGLFELFQKSGSQTRYTLYTGTCHSDGNRLIGEYSDGTSWGSIYIVSFKDGKLILSTYDNMGKLTFEKKALSEEEKSDADLASRSSHNENMTPIL